MDFEAISDKTEPGALLGCQRDSEMMQDGRRPISLVNIGLNTDPLLIYTIFGASYLASLSLLLDL